MDRKRRDLSTDSDDEKFEQQTAAETDGDREGTIEKRSSSKEISSSFDEVSELLEGSENNDDVHRRTRQLRPSIISSPWRISSARAVNFAPSHQNSFGSSFNGGSGGNSYPSATSGFLYKSDGRFYPTNPFNKQQDDFSPVISTYSGNNNKHKFSSNSNNNYQQQQFYDSSEREQESTPKYKQSSKIPSSQSHASSSALLPLLYSLESFEPKSKATTPPPAENQDNYSYFHLGKGSQSQQHQQHQGDKVKTYAFPVTSQQQGSTQRPFVSFNSVGGFFNNNQHSQSSSNQGFLPLKPVQNSGSNKYTPAPIYEGSKSASSYDSRYTTPSSIKSVPQSQSQQQSSFQSNSFLNNLNFNGGTQSIFNFGSENAIKKPQEEKIVEITTKKQSYKTQYPIPTSTPKYIPAFTTPNQLFDVDKFIAELRETQRLQNIQKTVSGSGHVHKNKTQHLFNPKNHYQIFTTPSPTTTTSSIRSTTLSDDYYYDDDEDEEVESTYNNGANLSKFNKYNYQTIEKHPQHTPIKDNHSSFSISKKPNLISSNAATGEDDEYYDEYEDDEDEFQFLPPPVNKPKYTPMTETMAPRPINVTTLRPYYVSGNTFSTPPSVTSTIPSIIKFPDDVFQAIRPFTSPKVVYSKNKQNLRPNSGNFEITKAPASSTTTERTSSTTRRLKVIKIATKSTTKKFSQVTSSTLKPTRVAAAVTKTPTTRRRPMYPSKLNRGNSRFKVSTKRPDLTRLEIDEKLPNR